MKYYKDPESGSVFAYEDDGSQDDYIPSNQVAMSKAEVAAFFTPKAYTDGATVVYSSSAILGWSLASPEQIAAHEAKKLLDDAVTEAVRLRKIADDAIAPLQDAVDLEEVTEAESALLKDWKRFRVMLNRLPEQADYPANIEWPTPPA